MKEKPGVTKKAYGVMILRESKNYLYIQLLPFKSNMKLLIIFICIINIPLISNSEPTEPIKYLMDEPLSLFDWGMYQLENRFKDSTLSINNDHYSSFNVFVYYDYARNRLNIITRFKLIQDIIDKTLPNNLKEAKERCKNTINYIKEELRIDPKTGNRFKEDLEYIGEDVIYSELYSFFTHTSYSTTTKSKDKKISSELDNITLLRASVSYHAPNIDKKKKLYNSLQCESMLRSNKILYSE